jgi:ribosomal protein L11 methylase PrmA
VPYRINLPHPVADACDRLIELGALDIDDSGPGIAALMPDSVTVDRIVTTVGTSAVCVSPALGRDDGSVWVLNQRPVRVGRAGRKVRLTDSGAFGTGLHPTTALCIEALEEAIDLLTPARLLDVGTGSGVLAIAALNLGVPRAVAIDVDLDAVTAAAENARLNDVRSSIHLLRAGPEAIRGAWPLIVANIQAAPLIELAPAVVRLLAHGSRLILSGVAHAVEPDVAAAYRRLGLRHVRTMERSGWTAVILDASW